MLKSKEINHATHFMIINITAFSFSCDNLLDYSNV